MNVATYLKLHLFLLKFMSTGKNNSLVMTNAISQLVFHFIYTYIVDKYESKLPSDFPYSIQVQQSSRRTECPRLTKARTTKPPNRVLGAAPVTFRVLSGFCS